MVEIIFLGAIFGLLLVFVMQWRAETKEAKEAMLLWGPMTEQICQLTALACQTLETVSKMQPPQAESAVLPETAGEQAEPKKDDPPLKMPPPIVLTPLAQMRAEDYRARRQTPLR